MNIEAAYAKTLYAAAEAHPERGRALLDDLRALLKRRGHTKLLPRIYREYEKLHLRAERSRRYATTTPEQEETRQLLELYHALIHT